MELKLDDVQTTALIPLADCKIYDLMYSKEGV